MQHITESQGIDLADAEGERVVQVHNFFCDASQVHLGNAAKGTESQRRVP